MEKNWHTLLTEHQPILLPETKPAFAVMVILLESESNEIVITKRAAHLPTYPGQYSFPGGMRDPHDPDLYATAIREVEEELHLTTEHYQFVCQLDDFTDRYGYLVRPYVTRIKKLVFIDQHQIARDEIASLYYFPLENLERIEDDTERQIITRRHPSYVYVDQDVLIWGLTASILVHLGNILKRLNKPLGKTIT